MKPNLCQDRYLAAGMGLFAACLALGRFAHAALGQFLSGALAGLCASSWQSRAAMSW